MCPVVRPAEAAAPLLSPNERGLATAPFFVGVSQSPQGLNCDNGQGDEHRSDSGEVHAHQGTCLVQPPPPPPGCVNSGPGTGTASITGQVFVDDQTQSLLAGWCVELRDAREGNNYIFTGVLAGTYTVCEELPANTTWHETFPPNGADCGGGLFGYIFPLADGNGADFISFGNLL